MTLEEMLMEGWMEEEGEGEKLARAVTKGNVDEMLNLLETGSSWYLDPQGMTFLHLASLHGQVDCVAALLDRGCDSNFLDLEGRSALQMAAAGGHLEMMRILLEAGASVDQQDEMERSTALHGAARGGFSSTLQLLCKSKANVYIKNRAGFTALHLSAQV